VGQFIDRKGRWTLLGAARTLVTTDPKFHFVWVAPEWPSADNSARVGQYGLAENFHLLRSRDVGSSRDEVLKFFRVADCFALPSFVEGLPIALLEAMALGVPSISTAVYAIPEAVKDLETGILIEAGDYKALANAIAKLQADPELRDRLARRGSQFVLAHFDEREAARIAIGQYEQALNE
jgi:glycosyltransferase involved in cell wall biosynthesis